NRHRLRQTEVKNLRLPASRHEDVCWLDVAVNDSFGMCRIHGVRDLDSEIEHGFDLQRFSGYEVLESLPLQQFHRNESSPVSLVNLGDRAVGGVVQGGGGFGFALEGDESLCVIGKIIGKEFEREVATEFEVFGFETPSHPPPADLAEDAVMGDRLPHGL